MSIISCTSPAASETIFPASRVTRRARSALAARSSSPSRRTSSPRRGGGGGGPGIEGDQPGEFGLGGTQFLAQQADQLAAARGRRRAPGQEGGVGGLDRLGH